MGCTPLTINEHSRSYNNTTVVLAFLNTNLESRDSLNIVLNRAFWDECNPPSEFHSIQASVSHMILVELVGKGHPHYDFGKIIDFPPGLQLKAFRHAFIDLLQNIRVTEDFDPVGLIKPSECDMRLF